ncbi:hypothetical protein CONPUDRAFT_82736 [Coniophora puteana RWD-64-598 SS2]|uniref:Uncharacterized protein n=1 Tax=Coniophora puteana (strain RWD-64-598) TaxID=741705 RepID=A0A5M3MN57_CONPW|nr:uncharacterized protein CONPUDRAFT_82736 [Coniophora puteana RWD-64-598 SS2]EIW80533.1 hypothetical protein CONPUDRAFT_82736 [Coniophora puteana RWD-64-598 SS2]
MAVDMRRRVGRSASNSQRTDGTLTGSAPTPSDSPKSRGGMVMQGADGSDSIHSPMDELRAQEAARSLHLLLRGSMGASLFPIFNDLSERIQAIDNGCGFPRDNRELLVNMLDRVRRALLPQVLSMLRSISNTVHLAWVTSIGRSVRESGSHSGCSDWSASSSPEAEAHSPATVGSISSDPGPYSEDSDAVLGESELLFPSSLVWEGKLMSMFRTCISPHVFSRASWNEPFSIWARVLLDSPLAEDGRDGITRADRLFGLETVLDSVRVMSWAYPSLDDNFIRTLERSTEALKADGTHDGGTAISSSPSFSHDTPSTSSHSLLPRATTATSIPTLKEVLEGVPHERVSDVFFGGSGAGGLGMEGTDSARNAIEELSSDLRSFIIGDEANHRDANLEINGLAHTAPSATAETYSLHPSASPLIDVVLLSTPPGLSAFTLAVDHASVIDPIPDLTMLTQDKSLIAQPAFFPPSQSMPNDVSGNWVSEGFGAQGYNEQYDHRHHLPDHQVLQHPPAIQSMFLGRTHLPHTVDIAYEMSSGMPAAHSMSAVELEAEFQRLFDGRESTRDGAFDPSIWKGFDSQGVLDWGSV